jgi:tRNA A-37 threonylcarbamoyl transferase component Bud32/tetratricopeptide (TPR) repeat protein
MGGAPTDDDATTTDTPHAAERKQVELPPRYRLHEILGQGGTGKVYRAHDRTLGRDVAIKITETTVPGPDNVLQRERFVREARAAARLVHPHIVAVHDVDPDAGWLVMDLVEGESLRQVAARGVSVPSLVRTIAEQVLSALDAAHAAGVVHRDIKPSNIILGKRDKVTLVDFGVAHLVDVEMTRVGESLGTPAYMAPEQIRGAVVDARTDLYGLGGTLYELVTGQRMVAFESPSAESLALLKISCAGDDALARVIERCLQAEPSARYASAREAMTALAEHRRPVRWRLVAVAGVAIAALAIAGVVWSRGGGDIDRRPTDAFKLAQRGEHDKASDILDGYLADHPGDADALATKLLADWWKGGVITGDARRARETRLSVAQRAMVQGIELVNERREAEAIAYLENADHDHPDQVEILYALGEARWHGVRLSEGVAMLERAFALDARWQMALPHVIEFRLGRGEGAKLAPLVDRLRTVDPASASVLACKIEIGARRYNTAATFARTALAREEQSPELYICLAQAQALLGDLDGGQASAKKAFDLWPVDIRDGGGLSQYAEFLLYRGRLDEYVKLVGGKPSAQRTLALSLWRPRPDLVEPMPPANRMRTPPFWTAVWILLGQTQGRDEVAVYRDYPEPEVRAYGEALWAETRGDTAAALAGYEKALTFPAKGDMRMLLSYHVARLRHAAGDTAGAIAACDEVVNPRMYLPYRAVLLPDCLLWSEDRAAWRRLVDAWQGPFDHPAVVEARRRLAEK